MQKKKYVIAIYGIQDVNENYPEISHDHGIALYERGNLKQYFQLERISRTKHDHSMPKKIFQLLKDEKLIKLPDDIRLVFVDNVLGRSFINTQGNIRFEAPMNENLLNHAERGRCFWVGKEVEAWVLNHELAHVCSCVPYFGRFKENSLLVHFDGGASKSNFSAWVYKNDKINLVGAGWDLKYLSSFFNANALVFLILNGNFKNHLGVPGKFMGFASFGQYDVKIEHWLEEHDFFSNIWNNKQVFFQAAKQFCGYSKNNFDQKDPFIQNIAATIHYIFERDIFNVMTNLQKHTGTGYLYYSGGSALNIKVNTRLVESRVFKDVYIPPCSNDSGLPIGAGAYIQMRSGWDIDLKNAYNNSIKTPAIYNCTLDTIRKVAGMLVDKKVIGICNGPGEDGPRALGNRSILSLASDKKLATKISCELKGREWYRPLAPVMLEKNARKVTGEKEIHHLAKFMLLDFEISEAYKKELEGVVHIDGTARIQVIFEQGQNAFIYDLLMYLNNTYDIKALINTSFNRAGEPIVQSANDAMVSAEQMGLDAVVINGNLYDVKKVC